MTSATRALGAILTTAALAVLPASPALADHDYKCSFGPSIPDTIEFCVYEAHDHYVHGQIRYKAFSSTPHTLTATMVVEQCSGTGTNCATITATPVTLSSSNGNWSLWAYGTNKPGAFGHTYRTCVSGTTTAGSRWTYVCTAFNAYTP